MKPPINPRTEEFLENLGNGKSLPEIESEESEEEE